MVAGVGVRNGRELSACLPVKLAGVHNDAAERRAVAADELGGRVEYDVRSVLDGPDQIGCAEGVVDCQRDAMGMSDGRDGVDVGNIGIRIAQGLQIDGFGVGPDRCRHFFQIVGVHESGLDAVEGKRMGQQVVASAVDGLLRNDMVTFLGQREDRIGDRRGAGSQRQRPHAAFECGKALFQYVLRGVCESAVDIARVRQIEARRRMGGVVKNIGCGLVNGDSSGIGGGVGLFLADVELQSLKFIVGHDMYLFSEIIFFWVLQGRGHIRPKR